MGSETNSTKESSKGGLPTPKEIAEMNKIIEMKDKKSFGDGESEIEEEKSQGIITIDTEKIDLINYKKIYGIDPNIKNKIEKLKKEKPKYLDEIKLFYNLDEEKLMIALGDKNIFKRVFLMPKYSSYKLIKYMFEEREEIKKKKEIYDKSKSEDDKDDLNAKINKFVIQANEKKKELGNRLRFSLRPSMASTNIFCRAVAKMTSQKFGGLHASLLLNNTVIEWGCGFCGNSLILPYTDLRALYLIINLKDKISEKQTNFLSKLWEFVKNFQFLKALEFLFSKEFQLKTLAEDELDLIAEFCVDYNKNKTYHPISSNCQIFVEDLLKKIDVKYKFDGEILKIIEKLKKGQENVNIEFRGKELKSHKELYDCAKQLDFSKLSENDRTLLFSYERIFNDLHSYDKENELYQSTPEIEGFWDELKGKYE